MKNFRAMVGGVLLGATLWSFAAEEKGRSDEALLAIVKDLKAMAQITAQEVPMQVKRSILCEAPNRDQDHARHGDRDASYLVFASKESEGKFKEKEAVFGEGAVILKQKFSQDVDGKKAVELFTGMVKREAGFNPQFGDWEFFTVSGAADKITARGKLETCMHCHRLYKASDFVTKNYEVRK